MSAAVGAADLALGVAVLVAAGVTVTVRDRLTAVVTFVLLGGLLALVWAGLRAPDLALAEAALGTGVTGALLVDAVADRRIPGDRRASSAPARRGVVATLAVAGAAAAALAAGLVAATLSAADADRHGPLTDSVASSLPGTATDHGITAVLLDFRAYDTLLEVGVLLAAVVGALALATAAPEPAAPHSPAGARTLVDFLRLASPVLLLLAVWLLVAGAYEPGGAFQGGALLAGTAILLALTGVPLRALHGVRGRLLVAVGPALFLASGAAGLLTAGHWLALPAGLETAATLTVETALAVSIGAGLTLLFLAVRRDPARLGDGARP